jgi:hypothetical protein
MEKLFNVMVVKVHDLVGLEGGTLAEQRSLAVGMSIDPRAS